MTSNKESISRIANRRNVKGIERTEHLITLDSVTYGENFVDLPVSLIKERYVIYGLVDGKDNLDKWLNPSRNGSGDNTVTVKVGMYHPAAEMYAGMTVREATMTRANGQVTESQPIEYYPIFVFASNDTDNNFREFIYKKCIKKAELPGENAPLSLNSVKRWYIKYLNGIDRTENYKMFPAQERCVDKMKKYFEKNNGGNCPAYFLLAAKPRFGKNFALMNLINELGVKNSLFVSYLPTVFSSLGDDIESHVLFDGWRYVNYRYERDFKRTGDETVVYSTSAQLLNYVEDGMDGEYSIEELNVLRDSLMNLSKENIELLVFDEAHFGANSEYIQNIINILNPKYVVMVTGTASKYKDDERFSNENTFEYDYIDECNDPSEHAKKMPKIRIYTYEIDKDLVSQAKKEYNTQEFVTMSKLFACDKRGNFKQENLVKLFYKEVFGRRDYSRENVKLNNISPFNNPVLEGKINHTFFVVPSVAAASASIRLLKKMGLNDEFEFYNAAGIDGIRDIDEIKRQIQSAKSKDKKTVTFVCDRFREGVTVADLGGVFLFEDGKSLDRYIQTIFRTQSPQNGKTECFVFDYCPERCLAMRYAHKHYYKKPGYSEEKMEKVLYECMPITYYGHDGNIIENEEFKNAMFRATHKFFGGFRGFGSSMFTVGKWAEHSTEIAHIFHGISAPPQNPRTISGQTNGIKGGKVRERIDRIKNGLGGGTPEGEKEAKKEYEILMNLCVEAMKKIPEFLLISGSKYHTIYDIANSCDGDIFEEITGIELDEFKMLVDGGFFRAESVNDLIYQFYEDKNNMFDVAMCYIDSEYDYDNAVELISAFEEKWIYRNEAEQIDVPYSVLHKFFN